jgi:hypothetical protein
MVAATVLSGPQLYILGSAWVYHEPILWGAVLAAAFNLIVMRTALSGEDLRTSALASLAAFAGLAINTRAPIGVALYFGTVLLIAWTAWSRHAPERTEWRWPASGKVLVTAVSAPARDPRISLPVLVLGLLAVAAGIVNFGRWGNPFAFSGANYTYWIQHHPNVIVAVRDYGVFNLDRIGIAVLYYATGIPYIFKSVPPFAGLLRCCVIEAPPFTPLLTNPLTVLLAGVGLYRLWCRPDLQRRSLVMLRIVLIGHCFRRCPDPRVSYFHVAVSLRFRAIHDIGGVRRLPLPFHDRRRFLRDMEKADTCSGIGIVCTGHPGKPLRSSRPQGVEHRCADEGAPRPLSLCTVRARCF